MDVAVVLLLLALIGVIAAWFCYDDDESRYGFLMCATMLALGSIGCSLCERWQMGVL